MKKILGKKTKREKSCFFPEKLFKILQNEKNHSIIHWDEEGKIVEIKNKFKFSNIIEKNFKGQNYNSFIRQLNLYGFEKLPNLKKSDKECFILENFRENADINDIKKIKRKKKNTNKNKEIKEIKDNKEIKDDKEINEKIDKILSEIEKEKNDLKIIEKYKSVINDDNISINNKFIKRVVMYIIKKKEELKLITNNQNLRLLLLYFEKNNRENREIKNYNLDLLRGSSVKKEEFQFLPPLKRKRSYSTTKPPNFDSQKKADNIQSSKILNNNNEQTLLRKSHFSFLSDCSDFFDKNDI